MTNVVGLKKKHIANLEFSKPRLSGVSGHHTHKLFRHHPSLSGKITPGFVNFFTFGSHWHRSLTMWPPLVVTPLASPTTAPTISLRAPRPSSTSWKTLASAGVFIKRICLILASRQIMLTKKLVQTTTFASTSKSAKTKTVRDYGSH